MAEGRCAPLTMVLLIRPTTVNYRQPLQTTVNALRVMPFDPTYPPTNAEIESAPLRAQLNGLKDLIDAVPTISGAVVDGVSTVNPGDPATVNLSISGGTLHFSFGIPRGQEGQAGQQGPQGQPFANFLVDSVTTLNPGENATVQTTFDGSNVRFQFGIPRGQNGNDGGMGAPGPPGEVTNMQLNNAINGTSSNSNAVATLGMTVSDPPTQAEVQGVLNKLNELLTALRR